MTKDFDFFFDNLMLFFGFANKISKSELIIFPSWNKQITITKVLLQSPNFFT